MSEQGRHPTGPGLRADRRENGQIAVGKVDPAQADTHRLHLSPPGAEEPYECRSADEGGEHALQFVTHAASVLLEGELTRFRTGSRLLGLVLQLLPPALHACAKTDREVEPRL